MSQKPSIGRIVHVFLRTGQIRPAIITRVGPHRVDEKDTGQVAYEIFHALEDAVLDTRGPKYGEGHERVEGEAWKAGDWMWPARV